MAITIKDLSSIRNVQDIFNGVSMNWPKLSESGLMIWLIFGFSAYCINSFKLRPKLSQIGKK